MSQHPQKQCNLRLATADDVDTVYRLIKDMAAEMGRMSEFTSQASDFAKNGFGKDPRFKVILAEQSGQAIGLCLYLRTWSSWRGESGIYVQDIYVDKAARGSDMAIRLLAEAARRSSELGAKFVRLSVGASNRRARAFYERLGITHSSQECIYMAMDEAFEKISKIRIN